MKLALVVQRYGADISGGAELHARYVAEHLSRHADVEVLTTCAQDYITWKNELPAGEDTVNKVRVRRFRVSRPRDPDDFGRRSALVFDRPHSVLDELSWLHSEGPTSPSLIRYIRRTREETDYFVFFSLRYYHAWHGIRAVPDKAVLVPTAERDPAVGVSIFSPVLRGARALMYNSLEERAMLQTVSRRQGPGTVVGVGSAIPSRPLPQRFRKKHGVRRRFAIYIGRIDQNKGCRDMFAHFTRYAASYPAGLDLILVGSKHMEIPDSPRITHVGFLPEQDKFDALAAADLLIMPSPYESLSMVALEAWALGRPVLVNGACDVLRGQCLRSRAGLYYDSADEFVEAMYVLDGTGPAGPYLGQNGREFYRRHYAWPVIERKYLEMFERLSHDPSAPTLEPLPGWLARRARTLPPAREVVDDLPRGPVSA